MAPYSSDDSHSPVNSTVIAIDKEKHSHYAVRWAVDHLANTIHNPLLILLHVRLKSSNYGGNGANDDLNQLFIPYRGYCARKGISMSEAVVEDSDVAKAILEYINSNLVNNLVLGVSAKNTYTFARSLMFSKHHDVQAAIMKSIPDFCSVYVICKGKIQSSRPAQRPITNTLAPPRVPSSGFLIQSLSDSEQDLVPTGQRSARRKPSEIYPQNRAFNPTQERHKAPINGSMDFNNNAFNQVAFQRNPTIQSSFSDESEGGMRGSIDISSHNSDIYGASCSSDESNPQTTKDIEAEMRRLKLELKQTMDMYSSACKEALTAKKGTPSANELNQWKMEEALKFEKAKLSEEAALAVAEMEKAKCRTALEAAEKAQRMAELEGQRRKQAEIKARSESEDKDRAMSALAYNDVRYRRYSIEEIEEATENFANHRKIGEGGYGPVYRGELDHTPVAIKVLRPDAAQGKKQFQQEVEVLSSIRHPHMVLLLGACPEYGCLVYELMENGSLEDILVRRGNSQPLSWKKRFEIAAEIATALSFLHQAKPEPLVHRDLKPANILLDKNYVSKISDVGLARLVPASVANNVTQYHMTSAAGTFCYIDPEYQQTGMLTTKSDIYSLGIMLLQIITARPPMGLAHHVSRAISRGTLKDMLDPTVPDWPLEEAQAFAAMSLRCAELRKRDRPDLGKDVVPLLIRLKNIGNDAGLTRADES